METSPKKKRFFHFPFFSCRNIVLLLFGAGRVTHIDRWKTKIRILSKSKQKGCTNTKKASKKDSKKGTIKLLSTSKENKKSIFK